MEAAIRASISTPVSAFVDAVDSMRAPDRLISIATSTCVNGRGWHSGINPDVCFGKPCIRGHRIWVSLILDFLASGETMEEILEDYPQVAREDVLACIAYGAEMARERYVEIPIEATR